MNEQTIDHGLTDLHDAVELFLAGAEDVTAVLVRVSTWGTARWLASYRSTMSPARALLLAADLSQIDNESALLLACVAIIEMRQAEEVLR